MGWIVPLQGGGGCTQTITMYHVLIFPITNKGASSKLPLKKPNVHGKTRWWQLKYFLFSPRILGEDEPILTSIFFNWVGSTTNYTLED